MHITFTSPLMFFVSCRHVIYRKSAHHAFFFVNSYVQAGCACVQCICLQFCYTHGLLNAAPAGRPTRARSRKCTHFLQSLFGPHHGNALLCLQPAAAAAAKLNAGHQAPASYINDRVPTAAQRVHVARCRQTADRGCVRHSMHKDKEDLKM
jgi:hypothetical protein